QHLPKLSSAQEEPLEWEACSVAENRARPRLETECRRDASRTHFAAADRGDRNPPLGLGHRLLEVSVTTQKSARLLERYVLTRSQRGEHRVILGIAGHRQ